MGGLALLALIGCTGSESLTFPEGERQLALEALRLTVATASARGEAPIVVPAPSAEEQRVLARWGLGAPAPDQGWMRHPAAEALLAVQAFPAAGSGAWFALHRRASDLDRDPEGLRPYVFRIDAEGALVELWRGSALAWPLVAARVTGERLCALHRDDSFLALRPETRGRRWVGYRWTGFGFAVEPGASCGGL